MAGIADIVERLEADLQERVSAHITLGIDIEELEEKKRIHHEIGTDIEALRAMIAAGRAQFNGHGTTEERPARENPFRPTDIRWYCFEVMTTESRAMHYKEVHKAIGTRYECRPNSVYNAMYSDREHFAGEGGYFTLVGN